MPVRTSSSSLSSVYERHAKPAFTGTLETWQKLPWNIKQYYSPPPETPPLEPTPKPEPVKTPIYGWRGSPYGVQRRVIVDYTTEPSGPTALELKKQEYPTFAKEYVKPVVESAAKAIAEAPKYSPILQPREGFVQQYLKKEVFPKERAKEESAIRKEWETQVAQIKKGAEGKIAPTELAKWEKEQEQKVYQPFIREWREAWKPKGLAERILEIGKTQPLPSVRGVTIGGQPQITVEPVRPLAGVAGFIAYPESLAYAGMTWMGKEPTTLPPPSPFGELKGTEYARGYAAAMVAGTLLVSEATSKIFEKTAKAKAGEWLTKRYVEKGPATWRGVPEKIVMKLTGAKPRLAQQIAASKGFPEVFSMKAAEAAEMSWMLETTPKTSALTLHVTKEVATKAVPLPHLFFRAGALSIGYLQEPLGFSRLEAGLKSAPQQIGIQVEKVTYPTIPYLPSAVTGAVTPSLMSQVATTIFGVGLVAATAKPPKTVLAVPPKVTPPKLKEILAPKIKRVEKLKPFTSQIPEIFERTTEKAASVLGIKQASLLKQATIQKTVQKQLGYQPPYPATPKMFVPPKFPDTFKLPRRRRRRGEEDIFGLFGRQKRFWPVMSPKEVMRFTGLPSKKKRRRR